MEISKIIFKESNRNHGYKGSIDEPSICPKCNRPIKPQELNYSMFKDENEQWFLVVQYLCKGCYGPFIAQYELELKDGQYQPERYASKLLSIEPVKYQERVFEERIATISPRFKSIYNQALQAESLSMDELAGMGYRKALEFLIKDFLVSKFPDEREKIEKPLLSTCIKKYVTDPNIKSNATQANWLGHDHAHYKKEYTEEDVEDLKEFIEAVVYWVNIELITKKRISSKKDQSSKHSDANLSEEDATGSETSSS